MIAPGPVVDLLVGCLSALMGGISLAAAVVAALVVIEGAVPQRFSTTP